MSSPTFDWHAPLFLPDGSVDAGAARAWVAAAHEALRRFHGASWTDDNAVWMGRLAHDCLHYQGNSPAELKAEDLDDLLFTLTPAQRATAPAPVEAAVPALRQLFAWGAEVHGSLGARAALESLDDALEQDFLAAMRVRPPAEPAEAPAAEPADEPAPQSRAERRAQGGGGRQRVKVRRKVGKRGRKRQR